MGGVSGVDPPSAWHGVSRGGRWSWLLLAAGAVVALALWQQQGYWEYSDGVYSLSARQLLHGQALYRDFAAAQPPLLYYVGAAALAVNDSPDGIRIAMAACEVAVSLLVLIAVVRLTGSTAAAQISAVASFATPWALREHAQLLPETLAAPLILAAALAAGSQRPRLAGAIGAIAVSCKLALGLPAVAIALAALRARRALVSLIGASLVVVGALAAVFGLPLWTDVVHAQAQSGGASVHYVVGLWLQAGWNVGPLGALAALALPLRASVRDPALGRALLAASLGSLCLLASLFKLGSYLTVLVVAEPPLLCLAAAGVVRALRARHGPHSSVPALLVAVAASALLLTESASLLVAPGDPVAFVRPLAGSGPARVLSSATVDRLAAEIRRCPRAAPVDGPPYLAFVANHRIAGSQPDQFIIQHAPVLARFRARAHADTVPCRVALPPGAR